MNTKRLIQVFLIQITLSSFCFSQSSDITQKVEILKEYYTKSISAQDSLRYRKLFFKEFPSSFNELQELYGYDKKPAPLYYEGVDHIINLFNKLNCIDDSIYYNKLIDISIGGHWDADAVNYFLHGMRERVLKKPDLTYYLLNLRTDSEIYGFFYFFFHGIHPPFKKIPTELLGHEDQYPRIYSQLMKGFEAAIKDSGH